MKTLCDPPGTRAPSQMCDMHRDGIDMQEKCIDMCDGKGCVGLAQVIIEVSGAGPSVETCRGCAVKTLEKLLNQTTTEEMKCITR